MRIKPLAVLLLSIFSTFSLTRAAANDINGTAANPSLGPEEALAAGLGMMVYNSSLLRNGDNVWQRIRDGFQLTEVNAKLVRYHERLYAARPDFFKKTLSRSHKYLFHILNEVERRGMPTEIALLPMIESAFVPTARSRVGASGLWQIMPTTGRHYGLEQTWWYDGRRDVMAATHTALNYLETLHEQFGDWNLALAAYNWGEGNVSRAIARAQASGQPASYDNLRMPAETRHYSPKLLAVRNLLAQPEKFGLQLEHFPNKPYFIAISPGRHMNLSIAARFAGIPLSEFKALNPAFNLPVFAHKPGRQMLIPAAHIDKFKANLNNWDKPLLTWQVYTPSAKDSVRAIANKVGMSPHELLAINNLTGNTLVAGQPLLVAFKDSATNSLAQDGSSAIMAATEQRTVRSQAIPTAQTRAFINRKKWNIPNEYVVRHGDTVLSIARRFGINHHDIIRWNNNTLVTQLQPGQRVKIQGL